MIKNSLREFVDRLMETGVIGDGDVRLLNRDVLPDNLTSREEADVLIALDRAILQKSDAWNDAFVRLLVDFSVWASRPTGRVDAEMAGWIVASLGAGGGPTQNGVKAAFEIVREAQQVDEILVAFVMNGVRRKPVREVAEVDWEALQTARIQRTDGGRRTADDDEPLPECARSIG